MGPSEVARRFESPFDTRERLYGSRSDEEDLAEETNSMPHYRISLLTDHRHIAGVREVDFTDDRTALKQASTAMTGYAGAEAWQRDLLVGDPRSERPDVTAPELDSGVGRLDGVCRSLGMEVRLGHRH